MSGDKCDHCGDLSGHGPVAGAYCAFRKACADDIKSRAKQVGADPVAAIDLLAHLCSVWSVADAHKAATYVLDLGWRPGHLIPALALSVPQPPGEPNER